MGQKLSQDKFNPKGHYIYWLRYFHYLKSIDFKTLLHTTVCTERILVWPPWCPGSAWCLHCLVTDGTQGRLVVVVQLVALQQGRHPPQAALRLAHIRTYVIQPRVNLPKNVTTEWGNSWLRETTSSELGESFGWVEKLMKISL